MAGFGFVEFDNSRVRHTPMLDPLTLHLIFSLINQDAEDALQHFNGKSFMGSKYVFLSVLFAYYLIFVLE